MTAQLRREELQRIVDTDHVQCGDAAAMARMLLAGMDSQPVAVPGHADCCSECGSKSLTWDVTVAKTSDVVQGRLRTSDVTGMFFLGCDECSETVSNVRMENIAVFLNACRAAMLKAGPVTAATVPDGWTANADANDALVMLDRIDTVDCDDDERIESVKSIIRRLAAGPAVSNCRENENSSTNDFRENSKTSTNRSREHFISLCNHFWNWQEFDQINAGDEEPRLGWDGKEFTHRVTQALWRMYQAAPEQEV